MPVSVNLCMFCKHRRHVGCAAFPGGIPGKVLDAVHDHRQPRKGT